MTVVDCCCMQSYSTKPILLIKKNIFNHLLKYRMLLPVLDGHLFFYALMDVILFAATTSATAVEATQETWCQVSFITSYLSSQSKADQGNISQCHLHNFL